MGHINIVDDAHWRELRKVHIGGSEVAALFGVNPWLTQWELWHRKAGNLPEPDLDSKDVVFWGKVLEPAIARGIAEKEGWKIRKVRRYMTHPTMEGFGATLDYEIVNHPDGAGDLEIKAADKFAFADFWSDGPPLQYLLQHQHQLATTGRDWGAIGVLVGGNRPEVFALKRHDDTIGRLEDAVGAFWASVHEGKEPEPDFARDLEALKALSLNAGKGTPWERDEALVPQLTELCVRYKIARAGETVAETEKKTIAAEILHIIGAATKATLDDFTISAPFIDATVVKEHSKKAHRRSPVVYDRKKKKGNGK